MSYKFAVTRRGDITRRFLGYWDDIPDAKKIDLIMRLIHYRANGEFECVNENPYLRLFNPVCEV